MSSIKNRHFPTTRLIIIPISGVLTIPTGEKATELPIDNYCFTDGSPALSGANIDVVVVVCQDDNQNA